MKRHPFEQLPDVEDEVAAFDVPQVTGQVAAFFVNNERRMCDAEAISMALGSGQLLHPPILVEKALRELQLVGAVYVAKETETPENKVVRIYSLNDYMLAQAVVDEVDGVSL